MGSPLRPLSVGDPSPLVRDRQAINEVLRVARKDAARGGAQVPGSVPALGVTPTATVYVRNDTAGDLDSWSVLALGDPEPDLTDDDAAHTWRGQPVFPGAAPASSSDPFAVLLHPVKAGAVGTAAVLGVVPVDLNVTDSSHTHASPAASTTATLATGTSGPAVIVWKESGTGTKRAVVLLCGQVPGAAGSIQVEDVDESPSVSSVTQVRFDSADGFVVSSPGAGIARVDVTAASLTAVGIVNLTSGQYLGAGIKQVQQLGIFDGGAGGAFLCAGVSPGMSCWNTDPADLSPVEGDADGYFYAGRLYGNERVTAAEYWTGANQGASGTFTTADAKTVTVTNGIITSIV